MSPRFAAVPKLTNATRRLARPTVALVAALLIGLSGPAQQVDGEPQPNPVRASGPVEPASQPPRGALTAKPGDPNMCDEVVDFGDGRAVVRRSPMAPGASGMDLLLLGSGLQVVQSEGAVCAIEGVGCPAEDCFCACASPDNCRFWAYYHGLPDGGWEAAATGPAEYELPPGAVDGWAWGPGAAKPPLEAPAQTRALLLGYQWLSGELRADGSMGGDPGTTSEAVFAAVSAGTAPSTWEADDLGLSPIDYLESVAASYSALGAAQAGKIAAAAAAGGQDPRDFGNMDLVAGIRAYYADSAGQFGSSTWDQAWAIVGLAAAGASIPGDAVEALVQLQNSDGGWGITAETDSDPDSTALALQALMASGEGRLQPPAMSGRNYLLNTQQDDGGWGHLDADSNANSTAYAVQSLVALAQNPFDVRWTTPTGADPVTFLVERQLNDGRIEHDASPADLMATLQTLPALAGRSFPIASPHVARQRAAEWIMRQRMDDGSFRSASALGTTMATIDAVLALKALGHDPDFAAIPGQRPSDYLKAHARDFVDQSPRAAGRMALAAAALGHDPRSFGSSDAVASIWSAYDSATGDFGRRASTWNNAWAILGLVAAGEAIPDQATQFLIDARCPEGGWGAQVGAASPDVESTALAVQALAAAGVSKDEAAMWLGVLALRGLQDHSATFEGGARLGDAAGTGRALGGLLAAGQHVGGPGWMRARPARLGMQSPLFGLIAMQDESGSFAGPAGDESPDSTYVAALGLALEPLPLGRARSAGELFMPFSLQWR